MLLGAVSIWTASAIPVLAGAGQESSGAEALQQRLMSLDGVVADFQQVITDARGVRIEESSGQLVLAKPNFRWEVADPFPQIIIARGNELQIYDPDLLQLTTRTLDHSTSLQDMPLTLLTREEIGLADEFEVRVSHSPKLVHYHLTPRSADVLFAGIELIFAAEVLHGLIITDHTGQQSTIRFSAVRSHQVIQSQMFELDLPADIDIVRG